MTMHDLLTNGLLKDTDPVKVIRPLTGNMIDVRRGRWFNDQILDFHNAEILEISWSKGKGWTILVEDFRGKL